MQELLYSMESVDQSIGMQKDTTLIANLQAAESGIEPIRRNSIIKNGGQKLRRNYMHGLVSTHTIDIIVNTTLIANLPSAK